MDPHLAPAYNRDGRQPETGINRVAIDIIVLIVTAAVGYHGLTWRDEDGKPDSVRLFFGCIALMFFMRVLFADVLGLWG